MKSIAGAWLPHGLAVALILAALPSSNHAAPLPADCMALSEVRIGMIGEARTVVQGFDLESFKAEIIGIERGALPGSSMILARLEGAALENHGIVQGMSGSPVYIDGKIIGAIAYGWSFAYHPVAGITPIEQMLTLWDELEGDPVDPRTGWVRASGGGTGARGGASRAARGWDWRSDWDRYRTQGGSAAPEPFTLRPTSARAVELVGAAPMELIPLSTPIFISRSSDRTISALEPFFAARGLSLLAAGSSGGSNERPATPSPSIIAGSALGIPIVTGDTTVTLIGTVTYRRGNRLIAFGHPLFFEGGSDAPMAQAYMFGFMQSYNTSFKLGEVRETVGTIRQDRQFGIGGVFGPGPERVEVTARVGGPAATQPRTYRYSVWEDRDFLPQMASILAVQDSFAASVAQGGRMTLDFHYTIRLADGRRVSKSMISSSQSGSTFGFSLAMLRDMFLLMQNPYEQLDIDSVELEIDARYGFRTDSLERATPRYSTLMAGETLEVSTVWQPFRAPKYTRTFSLDIPPGLKPGRYVVHMADAGTAQRIDQRHDPGRFAPLDIDETVRLAQRMEYPSNRLWLYLFEPGNSISLGSDSMQGAPGSIRGIIAATAPSSMQATIVGRQLSVHHAEFDYPISARRSFLIEVASYVAR